MKHKVRCVAAILGRPCISGVIHEEPTCPHYALHDRNEFDGDGQIPNVYQKCFCLLKKGTSGCCCGSLESETFAARLMSIRMGLTKVLEDR